jgi:hypothetical protein
MNTVRATDATTIAYDSGKGPALILVGGASQHRAPRAGCAAMVRLWAGQSGGRALV